MRVFISSTLKDLSDLRTRISQAVRTTGRAVAQMEVFGARPESPLEVSLREVRESDLLVLIIGERYGTVDPDTQLSITHLEFREAIANHLPVLAFILAVPESTQEPRDPRLKDFSDEVQSTTGITSERIAAREQVVERVVTALWSYIERYGTPSRLKTFPGFEDYFSPMLDQAAAFNLNHRLIGRTADLQKLCAFLASEQTVCVVVGAGGLGKSKILYELARWRSVQDGAALPVLRFYRIGIVLTAQAFRELPARNACIIIDDAHRLDRLDEFVNACRTQPAVTKLILTLRPGLIRAADPALRGVSSAMVGRVELQALDRVTSALELAQASLGNDKRELARALVQVSDGNPLVITVGAHLLNTQSVSLDLLDRKQDFIRAALDGLLSTIPNRLSGDISRDDLLSVVSAIQPIGPSDDATRGLIANRLGVPSSNVARSLAELAESQVLLRRGASARITPDVLGDNLLFEAAVTRAGEPTGFIDEMLEVFGETHLPNVLLNGAELDWRSDVEGRPVRVMQRVWERLRGSLPQRSHRRRRDLLVALSRPSHYAPEEVLGMVEWCVHHSEAPADDDPMAEFVQITQQAVLDQACEVLAIVGSHPSFAEQCTQLLWRIARNEDREPNQRPRHPFRVLKDLAGYRTDNDLRTIEGVLRELERIIGAGQHVGARYSVCEIIDESLEREVEFRDFDRKTFTFGARPLDVGRVREQRSLALLLLKRLALGQDVSSAADAVAHLSKLLMVPHFKFGRETRAEDVAAFRPEAEQVVTLLAEVASSSGCEIIRYLARRALLECEVEEWDGLGEHLESRLAAIPEIPLESVFDAVMHKPPASDARLEWEDADKRASEACQRTARALWEKHQQSEALIAFITPIMEQLKATRCRYNDGPFWFALAEAADSHLTRFAEDLLGSPSPTVRERLSVALRALREKGQIEDFEALVVRVAEAAEVETKRRVASNIRYCLHGGPEPCERDVRLIARLVQEKDHLVRASALEALRMFGARSTRNAIDVLVQADFGDDSTLAEQAISCLMPKNGIDPAILTDHDIDLLLAKLRNLRSIDDGHYHINEFLEFAATKRASSVVRMLLGRIDDSTLPENESGGGYRPMPFLAEHLHLGTIADREERRSLLRVIRENMLKETWQHSEYLPLLFRDMICDLDEAVEVIMEWGRLPDPEKVIAATGLLRAMPDSLIFIKHAELADLLENAQRLGGECYERISSRLHGLAIHKGVRTVPLEGPDLFYVEQANRAAGLAVQYADRPTVAQFYRDLQESAQGSIEFHQRQSDEEL